MVEVVYEETLLGHLLLDISLLGNEIPELARVRGSGDSASETNNDGGILLDTVDAGRHFGRS